MQLQPAGVSFSTRNVKVLTCLFGSTVISVN